MEFIWSFALKQSEGFMRLVPTLISQFTIVEAAAPLFMAPKSLPPGSAYAAWTGSGILGTFLAGIIWLDESRLSVA